MIRLLGQAQLGPHATDQALHDSVADGVAVTDTDGGVTKLPQPRQVFVAGAVGDVFAVDMQLALPGPVLVAFPCAVPSRLQEEARVTENLDFDDSLLTRLIVSTSSPPVT